MSFNLDDPRITAYVFDELDDQQREAFQNELDASDELREAVQQTRVALEHLSRGLQSEPPVALSESQRNNVAEEIQRVSGDNATSQTLAEPPVASGDRWAVRRWVAMGVLGALAASLLLVCGLAYQLIETDRQVAAAPDMAARESSAASEPTSQSASTPGGGAVRVPVPTGRASRSKPSSDASGPQSSPVKAPTFPNDSGSVTIQESLGRDVADSKETPTLASAPHAPATPAPAAPMPTNPFGGDMGGYGGMSGVPAPAAAGNASGGAIGGGGYGSGYGGYGGGGYGTASHSTDQVVADTRHYAYGLQLERGKDTEAKEAASALALYASDLGTGPGSSGDRYDRIVENPFRTVTDHPLSTFSIDVDTASYSKVRMFLMQNNQLPRPDAVRIEELVNYFTYDYQGPEDDVPFAAHIEIADCPWTPAHRLVRFGIKGQEMDRDKRPTSNLVFLLDVSGSMNQANKLPLVKQGMKMLVDQLGENDRVAIAVYAGAAGLVLESTTGDRKQVILDALDRLHAGGSTNGGQGIRLAYQTALDHFVGGGVNRVILCTDGDFNVGTTGTDELVRLAEENAKTGVFLSVLGFGMGNHNDSMLEQVSNKGNGNYAFIDSESEARKVLVEQMTGTLVTIAKDVKIQVEFNPAEVAAYRLIGYENRILAAEDFNDDKKDAGEIGAGHTVTALYEVVPADAESAVSTPAVDDLRYQSSTKFSKVAKSGELLTLKMRYKQPDGDTSQLLTFPVKDEGKTFGQASQDFRFAAAVASFGMLLRQSEYQGNATYAGVLETATEAARGDASGYRDEFLKMVRQAKELSGQ